MSETEGQEAKAVPPPRAKRGDRTTGRRARSSEGTTKELRGWTLSQHVSEESSPESSDRQHSDLREPVAERFLCSSPRKKGPTLSSRGAHSVGGGCGSALWAASLCRTPHSTRPGEEALLKAASVMLDLKLIHSVLRTFGCLCVMLDHAVYWINLGVKKQLKLQLP